MVSFCKVFGQGRVFIFQLIYDVGKTYFDFLVVRSAKFLPTKTFLFGATPRNNERSLSCGKSIVPCVESCIFSIFIKLNTLAGEKKNPIQFYLYLNNLLGNQMK
jgi:hypothetical protein